MIARELLSRGRIRMSHSCIARVFVVLIGLVTARMSQAADNESDMNCGVNCVYVVLKSQLPESGVTLTKLEEKLQPGPQGSSLEQLREAVVDSGLHGLAVRTDLELLRSRPRPFAFIAHLHRGHFVVVADATDDSVRIIDPPRESEVSVAGFQQEWNGDGLLISVNPILSEESHSRNQWWKKLSWRIAALLGLCGTIWFALAVVYRRFRPRRT